MPTMTPVSPIQSTVELYVRSALPQLAKMDGKYVTEIVITLSDDRRKTKLSARSVRPKDRRVVFAADTIEWDFSKEEPYASQIREYQQKVDEFLTNNPPPHVDSSRIVRVSTRPAAPVKPVFSQREIEAIRAGIEAIVPVTAHWGGACSTSSSWEIAMTEELERELLNTTKQ